jgi:D-methionine transport system substrate-binding protein
MQLVDARATSVACSGRTFENDMIRVESISYVITSGMQLTDALAREEGKEHVNWEVVRTEDVGKPFVADIVAALNSPAFKEYASKKFAGYNFPAEWEK